MGRLLEEPTLRDRSYVFADRADAGRRLAEKLKDFKDRDVRLFAIPAGGVPVAAEIARVLAVPLDLIIVRKIQLPWTTEAGFGALNPAGEAVFNRDLIRRMALNPEEIEAQVQKTLASIKLREDKLRGGRPYPELEGRPTIIVDDGLASGYTMLAALNFLKGRGAGEIIVAVPTAPERTAARFVNEVDLLVCLNVRTACAFAVAEAYENWYDLKEEEVLDILKSLPA